MIINSIRLFMKFLPIHAIVIFTLSGVFLYHIFKSQKAKTFVLIIWGLAFACLYGSFKFTVLTIVIAILVYSFSILLIKAKNSLFKKILLILGIIISLGTLFLYKYPVLKSQLPLSMQVKALGISYFTFKFLHVLIDTYRGRIKDLDFSVFIAFIFFFPTFSAGPIDRYSRFKRGFGESSIKKENIDIGISRIIYGLFKKFIIADKTGVLIAKLAPDVLKAPVLILWAIVFLYSIRIYYDFSGYTDIAIGLGRFFGFIVPENFNRPYLKANITAFWQNWHMTLTSWLREYLFMPLGKSLMFSIGTGHTWLINGICQLITMAAVGIWHGSTLSFFIWGIYHGVGLSLYKIYSDLLKKYASERFVDFLNESKFVHYGNIFLTFVFVSIGWVFFSFQWPMAIQLVKKLWFVF